MTLHLNRVCPIYILQNHLSDQKYWFCCLSAWILVINTIFSTVFWTRNLQVKEKPLLNIINFQSVNAVYLLHSSSCPIKDFMVIVVKYENHLKLRLQLIPTWTFQCVWESHVHKLICSNFSNKNVMRPPYIGPCFILFINNV